jgi:arginine exporter protein ArgO
MELFSGGKMMKNLVYIVGILVLFYFAFQSMQLQQHADNFIEHNQAREQKLLDDFLSNKN